MTSAWSKREWRTELRRRRMDTDEATIRAILDHAHDWVAARQPTCVHGYVAKRDAHEIDLQGLLSRLTETGVKVVVPRILDVSTGTMELVAWHAEMPHLPNRFGIEEPVGGDVVDRMTVDLWIVPLLGADTTGNRLGYGAGFYDRMLRDTPGTKVGLLPQSCVVDRLPFDPHDVPLDVMITENGVFHTYL